MRLVVIHPDDQAIVQISFKMIGWKPSLWCRRVRMICLIGLDIFFQFLLGVLARRQVHLLNFKYLLKKIIDFGLLRVLILVLL